MESPTGNTREAAISRLAGLTQAVLVVFAAFLVAAAVVAPTSAWLVDVGMLAAGSLALNVTRTVLQFVGFVVAIVGFLALTDTWGVLHTRRPTGRALLLAGGAVVALLAMQFGAGFLFQALGVSFGENQVITQGREAPVYFLYMIPVSLLLVGPIEELLFRGVVQGVLRKGFGVRWGIVLASALFGLVHWVAVSGGPLEKLAYVTIAAVLGIVLGVLYERTETIVAPALAHGVYNSVLFVIQYAGATGTV
ncbi:CPBP family intramembrane metalloprotease [Salinigranum rubrum]|uniref:CPBP family intramembrane metalloprotease n=1 Tax=Salinigranum rubrum TaxID=755307 RepID=A0A2I8VP86_9EURY|nr:CPBP family intramembrane glutamic endopeptidase [Salinigranum rubrum]AUV83732.1 CPBP family intramembrane metalloprotease [Salinigranum rubrum]